MHTIWIGVAGFFGAISRYHFEGLVSRRFSGAFPWGTLGVNLSGCFLLGFIFTLMTERFLPHPDLRSAITIGFLGALRPSQRSRTNRSGSARTVRSASPF